MLNEKQIDRMLSKLKRYEDTLDAMIFEKVADLPVSFYQTGESLYEIPDESLFAPMAVGSHWGGEGVYGWFRTGWQVPKELAGRPLFLRPKVGGYEALLWVDGKPFGTFATKIVVTGHGNHYCDMVVKNPKAGQEVAVLEAMKMENAITSDFAGTVKQILVRQGQTVATDAVLMEIE